jgi:hypothetical protein
MTRNAGAGKRRGGYRPSEEVLATADRTRGRPNA